MNRVDQIEQVAETLIARIAARQERDAKLATGGQTRSKSYCAYFATEQFRGEVIDYGINLDLFFGLCDKTLNRYELMMKALKSDTFFMRNENDQNRYAFNIIRTMCNGHALKVAQITKADVFASGQKVDAEHANGYVKISSQFMSDETVKRQTGIALYVLQALNVCEVQKVGNAIVGYKVNDKSAMFKRLAKIVKAENAAQN